MDLRSELTSSDYRRYARHLAIPEFGAEGQKRLKNARVLCIGAGGLGAPATLYLAAAGIGTIGIVDADVVELSNLQRQILYSEADLGRPKLEAAKDRLLGMNPDIEICMHPQRFSAENAMETVAHYDVVIDGTDNFPTRYLSNDVCFWQKKPNIYGSILRFEGQVAVFAPHLGGPCYRCMSPTPPAPGLVPTCAEGGVLGALPGIIGTFQALECIKLIAGLGQPLLGRLLHVNTLSMRFREFQLRRDPECPVCGDQPTITEPIDYDGFCHVSSAPTMKEISVQELAQLREQGKPHLLLDVREPDEYQVARIEGSRLIPLALVAPRSGELPRDIPIYLHCKLGGRSAKAVAQLEAQGFSNVFNVTGGIQAWSHHIDATVPLY
jgi:molybdopterin/thiamine biosynthesis adenylyltransferase/rhodanese-related sulfurtransferase